MNDFANLNMANENKPIGINGKVLLVDGLNTYIRCFAATPTMNDDGEHVGGITGFLLSMGKVIRDFKPTRCVVVFDGVGGSQRRRALFGDYKSGRRMMTKLNRTYDFKTLEEEEKARKWQLSLLHQMLKCLPVTVIVQDNVEADDVIAYLAQTVEARGGKSIIMSNDKDFLQLVNENTSVWNPAKKKMYHPAEVVEDYGFHPNNFLIYRAITGDDSDSIPGVKGIGEKTLLKMFPSLATETKSSIEDLLNAANTVTAFEKKPSKSMLSLVENADIVTRNHQLMRLDDVAMSGINRVKVVEQLDETVTQIQKLELTKLATMNKLMGAFGRWNEWVLMTWAALAQYARRSE